METKLPLVENNPGIQIEKLNVSQKCALAAIKAKDGCDKNNWKVEGSDYSPLFGTHEISSRIQCLLFCSKL